MGWDNRANTICKDQRRYNRHNMDIAVDTTPPATNRADLCGFTIGSGFDNISFFTAYTISVGSKWEGSRSQCPLLSLSWRPSQLSLDNLAEAQVRISETSGHPLGKTDDLFLKSRDKDGSSRWCGNSVLSAFSSYTVLLTQQVYHGELETSLQSCTVAIWVL